MAEATAVALAQDALGALGLQGDGKGGSWGQPPAPVLFFQDRGEHVQHPSAQLTTWRDELARRAAESLNRIWHFGT